MSRRRFQLWLLLMVTAYLALELLYVQRLPLVMDELQGARMAHRLGEGLPYRDVRPYKTVLGYYLQLPVLALVPDSWRALLAVKVEMALLTAAGLALAALRLARRWRRPAVLAGLGLLLPMSTFLERSAELRLEMPTALVALASLVVLLEGRFGLGGVLAGAAFLTSQKGLYHLLAGGAGLLVATAVGRRDPGPPGAVGLHGLLRYGAGAAATLLLYLASWSLPASPGAVLEATFGTAAGAALGGGYGVHGRFWLQTLARNPMFWGLAAAALVLLGGRCAARRAPSGESLVWGYAAALSLLCLLHPEPWPYFFVLLLPTLAVLLMAFFHRLLEGSPSPGTRRTVALLLVLGGVVLPLLRVPVNLERSQAFQRQMAGLAESLLEPSETYLAGVALLFRREQGPAALRWLDRRAQRALHRLDPAGLEGICRELRTRGPKLVVDNYRLQALPSRLRRCLTGEFLPYWGNVLLYAPRIGPRESVLRLRFAGSYRLEGAAPVVVDGRLWRPGERRSLAAGTREVETSTPARLRLLPPRPSPWATESSRRPRPLFPDVYVY